MTSTSSPSGSHAAQHCVLTLTLPQSLEEALLDALLAHEASRATFTVLRGHAMGPEVRLHSALEQVQGRAQRVFLQVHCPVTEVPTLIQALQQAAAHPEVLWWTTPILSQGSLA